MEQKQEDITTLGLTTEQAERSRETHGANILTPPARPSVWKLYLEKFNDPIIRILLLAAVLSLGLGFMHGEFIETIGIFIAIILATSISFYFELDAARRFEELNAMGKDDLMTVARDGRIVQIKRSEIVVGDIVLLEQGVEVPADGDLVTATSLQLNESSLTGELIVEKTTDESRFDDEATYPSNHVLRSTLVVDGHGVMRVTAVGDATEIGKVSEQATVQTEAETPLSRQLHQLANFISRIAFTIAIVAFFIFSAGLISDLYTQITNNTPIDWLFTIEQLLKYFMMSITLIVMAVPEGLPMAVSLSLALNMRRMLKTNNLVRKMHACETMGAVTVICTDKTGTLTQNKMHVADMWLQGNEEQLTEAIAVNTTAHIQKDDKGQDEGVGNPTECALLLWLNAKGESYALWREKSPTLSQLTFSTEQKYMATLVQSAVTGKRIIYVKGAPEIVSKYCTLTAEQSTALAAQAAQYQGSAMRTLLMACREVGETEGDDCMALVAQGGLSVQALVGIEDPVREEVPAAVAQCTSAGIGIKIVTGDTQGTAVEIARRIGLWQPSDTPDMHITGPEFAELSDEEALQRIKKLKVMSRARPLNKQRLVNLLQQSGEVVAVTGDGTNDAPALNHAQVGLSMGSGTSVAKEASDITLLDDSFRSIATAVLWGRSLYKNIQRFVTFQLTINLAALLIVLIGAFLGTGELPLTVTQILWINIIMDTLAALGLSTIAPSPQVMFEQPRKASDFIISSSMKWNIFMTGVLFSAALLGFLIYYNSKGMTPQHLTEFFTIFVLLQVWNLMNAKVFGTTQSAFSGLLKDKTLLGVMGLIIAGQVLIVTFGGGVFRTTPLSLDTWLYLIGGTSVVLWIGELVRLFMRLFSKK